MTQAKDDKDNLSLLRIKAEEMTRSNSLDHKDVSQLSQEELQRLFHELRVHQIELEMQNEELRQSQLKLEYLKDKFLELYDFSPVGYMTLSDKGLILEANLTAVGLLGVEKTNLIKKFFSQFVCQGFVALYYLYLKKVFESQAKQTCEIKLIRKDGTVFYAQLESIAVQDESGHTINCRTIFTDISEHKQAKDALQTKTRQLNERVKELNCLYAISQLVEESDMRLDQILQGVVDIIPPSWQYPEITCAKIILQDREFKTENYKVPLPKQSAGIIVHGEHIGVLEVGYLDETPEIDEGPFLKDERRLVNAIAERLGRIVERKQTKEAFQISQEKFAKAFQCSPDAILISRITDGRLVDVNEGFCLLSGYSRDEALQRSTIGLNLWIDPQDRETVIAALQEKGSARDYEFSFRNRSGKILNCLYSGEIITIGEEPHILSVVRDITERKRWEEELRTTLERFYTILSSLYAGLLLVTNENRVEFINQAMCDLFDIEDSPETLRGLSALEMIGKLKDLYAQPAEILARIGQVVSQNMPFRGEEVAIRGGRTYLVDYVPIVIDGKAYGRVWHHTDISERKRAEQEKEVLRSQLLQSQKMEAVGTLAAGIAHDFNNMLQTILGYSEILLDEKSKGEPGYAELQKIVATSIEARDLVQKIRIFSRKADIQPVAVDLNHQLRELTKLLSHTLLKTIDKNVRLGENLDLIKADPALMDQMVTNLAINASEAMPDGGTLTIETQNVMLEDEFCKTHIGAKSGPHVLLTISDTGRGMTKELIDRIFDPFFSTKQRDYHRGTGLGLSIVKGIVDEHSGYITVDSEVGKGTTFKIYFSTLSSLQKPQVQVETKIERTSEGGETILLVEDEELVRDLGIKLLERFGYRVIAVCDGQEAVEVYAKEQENIALVILDIVMPRMDGKECLQELLKINPAVKVLISSGVAQDDRVKEVVDLGARGALFKPYSMKVLQEKVREVLDGD